jgi:trehalose 6-phosphate phosphatase
LIAPTPDTASVDDHARDAMGRLAEHLDVVGAVTGRAAENAETLVGVPNLLYIGNHGLEQRVGGVTHINPAAVVATGSVAESMAAVKSAADGFGVTDGIIYENKGVTGSIHYRLAKDQDHAHAFLLPLIQAAADARGLKVTEGRMVIELRPMLPINKGTALRSVVEQEGLKSLIFLGDDVTDLDAFRAVAHLREEGRIAGLNIAVVSPEANPEIAKAADAVVHGVECCVRLLSVIADALDQEEMLTSG